MGIIRYGKTAQIGVYPGNQSGPFISYRKTGVGFPLDPDTTAAWLFAKDKSLVDAIGGATFGLVRASDATYYDSNGILRVAGPNVARFDHDPNTLESLGVLIEEAGQNLFINSGTPVTQDITTTAQSYTVQVWGTGDITLSGTATGTATEGNPLTVVATAGTLTCTVNGSLSRAQVEDNAWATSYIPTGGTPAPRAADDFVLINMGWFNQGGPGTFYISCRFQNPLSNQRLFGCGNAFNNTDALDMLLVSGGTSFSSNMSVGGVLEFTSVGGTVIAGLNKAAIAYDLVSARGAYNGVLGAEDTTIANILNTADNVKLGRRINATFYLNGHVSEFGFADVRKSDTFIGNLTS